MIQFFFGGRGGKGGSFAIGLAPAEGVAACGDATGFGKVAPAFAGGGSGRGTGFCGTGGELDSESVVASVGTVFRVAGGGSGTRVGDGVCAGS